ncbi:MAG: DUF421 domain-containing protein [Firmicutes bacterium]|nr:DUF421 domain-containing protein [Bacillota bacterium]
MAEIVEVVVRSVVAFLTLLLMARLMGKVQISQLTFFEYIVGITIGSVAASMSIDTNLPTTSAITGIIVWTAMVIITSRLVLNNIPARKIIQGEPTVLVKNGKVMESAMKRVAYNVSELLTQLRNEQIFDLSQVEEAVLETNGKLSILLKSQNQPLTPSDLNIDTKYKGMPEVLVVDGNIAGHRLKELGLTEGWLYQELKNLGINELSEVMVAQLNTQGELYVDKKSDWDGWQ